MFSAVLVRVHGKLCLQGPPEKKTPQMMYWASFVAFLSTLWLFNIAMV
jgi:hypothetical protein